jgi:Xaa-Pro dipeptidase
MNRFDQLVAEIKKARLDAIALVPGANLRYFTGLELHASERVSVVFVSATGEVSVVLPQLEQPRAAAQAALPMRFYPWADGDGPQLAMQRCVADLEIGDQLGVEFTAMRILEMHCIETAMSVEAHDAGPLFAELRMRKDAEELAAMRQAVQIIEGALEATLAQISMGMTERECGAIWDREIQARGGSPSFTTIVAAGPHSANPHHSNGERPLQAGDLVIFDGGSWYNGYTSDITRTVAIGEPSPLAREVYTLVQQANEAGREAAAQPGASGDSIDAAARAVISAAGYGKQFVHRTGHGIGLEVHEPPYIMAGNTDPLLIGATFTIEPGVYLPGAFGVRIEDNVVITATGAECLTSFNRDLIVIDR